MATLEEVLDAANKARDEATEANTAVKTLVAALGERCPMHAQQISATNGRVNALSNRLWGFIAGVALALVGLIAKLWGGK